MHFSDRLGGSEPIVAQFDTPDVSPPDQKSEVACGQSTDLSRLSQSDQFVQSEQAGTAIVIIMWHLHEALMVFRSLDLTQ
jgi:hypothetical protein